MKKVFAILLALAMVLSLAGCSSTPATTTAAPSEATTTKAAESEAPAGDPIQIGAVLPLTGSSTGEFLKAAMEVAQDIINNSHDLDWDLAKNKGILGGRPVELVFADHQASADIATTEAAKLLDQGVVAITGAYNSGCSASVATQALEYGVPMVCGSSSSASLTDGSTYAFKSIFNRVAANDEQESQEFFEYLKYLNETCNAGIEKVAIAWINNSYGIHANEMFEKYAAQYGFQEVASVSYESSSTSFDTEAAQIKESGADAVFQASYIGDLTLFAQAYSSLQFKPAAIVCYCGGFQDASFAKVATDLGVNNYAGGQACTAQLADKLPIFSYVNELYKAKTGQDIDGPALEEFASVIVAAQAINAAGSTDAKAINETLKSTTFEAPYLITQKIHFDENGQNDIMPAVVTQLIDGKYEVVFPRDEYATADPVLDK
ncbi:MAG: ABC transporter substrate-binding protein [Lachnospiraceae bacterium]|nr:ABC transporter substrate-binding protein [Lachnospiraceae bacterium]